MSDSLCEEQIIASAIVKALERRGLGEEETIASLALAFAASVAAADISEMQVWQVLTDITRAIWDMRDIKEKEGL